MNKKTLITIVIFFTIVITKAQQIDTLKGPTGSQIFGNRITVLSNGNYVVNDPYFDDGNITSVGAVYLYNGSNHTLISTLKGSNANDRVGIYGITALSNGNYLVSSPNWNDTRGAVTWCNGNTGISGTVNSNNSLVGSNINDFLGNNEITLLSNGNYVIKCVNWNNGRGSATWGNGNSGISGTVNSSNSLVGTNANGFDFVGNTGIIALSNGNYVVGSANWNGNIGAATWGDGSVGISGTINSNNSLIGSNSNDRISSGGIFALSNGNYVVSSREWNGNLGAATFGNGRTGIKGIVSSSNSLLGSNVNDRVGINGITTLSNGNYVVSSSTWNGNRGAATWGDGTLGTSGTVGSNNSLLGSNANDRISSGGIIALRNGNYVVRSPDWNGNRGAVTWGKGNTGIFGTISLNNSLVGNLVNDRIGNNWVIELSNGNYVVGSATWNGNRGAASWGDGSTGFSGTAGASNSLVGSNLNDNVGQGIFALKNGNYVVTSPTWNGNRGAATWGDGITGISGAVNSSNSLVGSNLNDYVGNDGITALNNGNFVVKSVFWNNNRGAATWGNGNIGIFGTVNSNNSLVGSNVGDNVGGIIFALTNGNYVVSSRVWNGYIGAATWGNGSTGIFGTVSSNNSLIGSNTNDKVGFDITVLNNGNYVVRSYNWNDNRGSVSVSCNSNPIIGTVSALNSILGEKTISALGLHPVVNNAIYNYVLISSQNENKLYIYKCPQPEIIVKGNGISIVNGDITSSLLDSTDMGATSSNLVRRFRIVNSGTDTLKISNIISSGIDASNFVVSNIPNKISAGDSSLFTVTFSSSTVGIKNASIKIFSNDVINDTFQFAVRAEKLTNTKITNVDLSENISVYPNPFSSLLNIDIKSLIDGETAKITIFDALGKMVFKQDITSNAVIDINHLSNGFYSLSVQTISNTYRIKLLKN